jgi:hypothetical protein
MSLPEKLKAHREYVELILTTPLKKLEREVESHLYHSSVALQYDLNGDKTALNGDWWSDGSTNLFQ